MIPGLPGSAGLAPLRARKKGESASEISSTGRAKERNNKVRLPKDDERRKIERERKAKISERRRRFASNRFRELMSDSDTDNENGNEKRKGKRKRNRTMKSERNTKHGKYRK